MPLYNYKGDAICGLTGKKMSILGDSISTYDGYNPPGYDVYYPRGDVDAVGKTWWGQLMSMTGLDLLKNASWSGCRVSGDTTITSGRVGCSDARINDLKDGDTLPDIIFCYISTNDWGGTANLPTLGDFDSKSDVDLSSEYISTISDAYALMLYKIRNAYPNAFVYCITSLEGRPATNGDDTYPIINANGITIHQVNHAIEEIAHIFGARVIDLQTCGINYWNVREYTIDGHVHPNEAGASIIANTICRQLIHDFM
jgi:lysophospholipase L1-like esterase